MVDVPSRLANGSQENRDLTGATVGRFQIRARLGAGGMGEVYRAEDTVLKRAVALKRMAPRLRDDPTSRKRFLHEAERASRLNDPHIAGLYDVLQENDEVFLVMEYVQGETLRQRLNRPMPLGTFFDFAVQCAQALTAAHEQAILHHDIKPENIMLTGTGQAKILDFGVAKEILQREESPTVSGVSSRSAAFSGTLAYMAPEVLMEEEADGRADIFSLGVVFYETLTGRHPFEAEGVMATADRIRHDEPAPLSQFIPAAPAELERILGKMLAKNRDERYATAADLVVDLRAVQRGAAPVVQAAPEKRVRRGLSRRGAVAVALAVIAVAAVVTYRVTRPTVFAGRDWVVVTDIENRSGEPVFDGTVREQLQSALLQSRYVNVVPRAQGLEVARSAGHTDVGVVDAALGREICQQGNYRALLTGRIEKAAGGFLVTVAVEDPWRGVPLITESEPFRETAELEASVNRIVGRMRESLGESLTQIERNSKPLKEVTTTSEEARRRYARAVGAYEQGELQRCIDSASGAIEQDPNFPMAHLYMANAYMRLGNRVDSQKHLTRALEGLDRVSEREKLLIRGTDYSAQRQYENAAREFRRLTEEYPDDVQGYRELADADQGKGDLEGAIEAAQRAVELTPRSPIDLGRLVYFLDLSSRFKEAIESYQKAAGKRIYGTQLLWGAGVAYLGAGDVAAARSAFEELEKSGGDYERNLGQLYLSRVLMYEGRLGEAAEALRTGLVLDEKMRSAEWLTVRLYLLASVELLRGRKNEARAAAQQLTLAAMKGASPSELRRAALLNWHLGDLTTARQVLARLDALRKDQGSAYAQSSYLNVKAALAVASGQPQTAIEEASKAPVFFKSFEAYDILGEAHQAMADWIKAAEAHEELLALKGQILWMAFPSDWVMAHLDAARAYARAGQSERALAHYDEFLRIWEHADADLKVVREARAERAALVAGAAKSSNLPRGR